MSTIRQPCLWSVILVEAARELGNAESLERSTAGSYEEPRRLQQLIDRARECRPLRTAVVHPTDEVSLLGAIEAARQGLISPVLVGPGQRIREVARAAQIDLSPYTVVAAEHGSLSAARAIAMARAGQVEALMKGALHTDELMHAAVDPEHGLRTARRASHVFVIESPRYPRLLFITDAAINIYPTLEDKRDIVQNAIDLARTLGVRTPRVAILSALELVTSRIKSTIEAAALCKWPIGARSRAACSTDRSGSTTRSRSRLRRPSTSCRPSPAERTSLSFPTSKPATCSLSSSSIFPARDWPG